MQILVGEKKRGYSLIPWRSAAFNFHKYKYKECTQPMKCVSLGRGAHTCTRLHAHKRTRGCSTQR